VALAVVTDALNAVRARLARAVVPLPDGDASVGQFTLRPGQRAAVVAIREALASLGGALLADPPGTGKTVIALAVARDYGDALVLAPAALRDQWFRAAGLAGARIRFVSLEALSRAASSAQVRAPLLIVDEAHQLRTTCTRRYQRTAMLAAGARVLLLTATPVVNRVTDRDALLALFLGGRAATLSPSVLARAIIRRDAERAELPPIVRLPSLITGADDHGIGTALGALPPPFPTADGTAALALIRITLAMAWCSSLAALDGALRRRVQRGQALADVLTSGRWPDRRDLRHWVLSDDTTQLAFADLVFTAMPESTRIPPRDALPLLSEHMEAVRRLRARLASSVADDTAARANALRRLCLEYPHDRLVLFAHHADTIRALWRELRHVPGVVAITGERVHAAQGRWSRAEILSALGPQGKPWRRDDVRGIRLVLATDLLSEGVELQGARILVHGDGAWTPARLEQRIGRLARVGATASSVLVTHFRAPPGARPILRLGERLRRKMSVRGSATAAARDAEIVHRHLAPWRSLPLTAGRTAAVVAPQTGFIAAVRLDGRVQLVAGRLQGRRYRVSSEPRSIADLLELATGAVHSSEPDATEVRAARLALGRWTRQRLGEDHAGDPRGADSQHVRKARARIDQALSSARVSVRPALAVQLNAAIRTLANASGAGTTKRLQQLLSEIREPSEFAAALIALASDLGRYQAAPARTIVAKPRLCALLLLSAARSAPPGVSPKTAAPR